VEAGFRVRWRAGMDGARGGGVAWKPGIGRNVSCQGAGRMNEKAMTIEERPASSRGAAAGSGEAAIVAGGRRGAAAGATALVLSALVVWAVADQRRLPAPVPASAPAEVFASGRALAHVRVLAQEPRPAGSVAHARVQAYLLEELRGLGLEPHVQEATAIAGRFGAAGRVANIVARVEGTGARGDALLLVAHYDGVGAGPAAGDDAAGVAALLEAVRALQAGPPLDRDVLLLLSDAEEDGLLGASAFIAEHPWLEEVGAVFNFEARGTGGRPLLFETGPGSGGLVRAFAGAVPRAAGSSLGDEIYRRMPNDSDFTLFRRAGLPGLNFAFIEGVGYYHTALDDIERLAEGSLQQHGATALALVRRLGRGDLPVAGGDVAFFHLPAAGMVVYGLGWTWPLLLLGLAAVLAATLRGGVRRRFTPGELLLAGAAGVAAILVAGLAAVGAWLLVARSHGAMANPGQPALSGIYAVALSALGGAVALGIWTAARRWAGVEALALAGAAVLLSVAALLAVSAPGAAHPFLWPLLAAAAVATAAVWTGGAERPWAVAGLSWIGAVVAIFLLVPLLFYVYLGLGLAPASAAVLGAIAALVVWALPFHAERMAAPGRWAPPGGLLILALLLFGAGLLTVRYDERRPRPSLLLYTLDAESGSARWLGPAWGEADPWLDHFVDDQATAAALPLVLHADRMLAYLSRSGLLRGGAAPAYPLQPPEAEAIGAMALPEGRTIDVRIGSPRGARMLLIHSPHRITAAELDGRSLPRPENGGGGPLLLRYINPPDTGIVLRLTTLDQPIALDVADQSLGLPAAAAPVPPRPPDLAPRQSGDLTLVRRRFTF
jgi:hypothetical protein